MKHLTFALVTLTCSLMFSKQHSHAQEPIDFAHDVLPVLRDRCASCHSNGTYKGDFSIDIRESILDSGVIDLDEPAQSELIHRITSDDPEYQMPPTGKRLTPDQVSRFTTWIETDLAWEEGFTFAVSTWKAPIEFREVTLPPGDGNAIDRILSRYFAEKNIAPSELTNDSVLIRRAYLDLIGTLPTIAEQDAFRADTDAAKHQRLVQTLLNRNRDYADHWMSFWNDLLRNDYEGTGYIDGGRKQITRWLHHSLYDNKAYDQFARELIDPNQDSEGFVQGIQWRGNINASQVREVQFAQNVTQVFLGENLKCASCHDSFINDWKLADAYAIAAIIAEQPIEMVRCDIPTGKFAEARFLWPELGNISPGAANPADRLREFSLLVTGENNGRFARTIANRIWQRMMGQGIVEPVDVMGNEPFDEELIDYLALFLKENNYNLKALIELIATSNAYRRSSVVQLESSSVDFSGPVQRRLTAEQFLDAVWGVAGTFPEKIDAEIDDYGEPATRVRAALVVSDLIMRDLGRPNREQVVTTRDEQLSSLQAIALGNGQPFFDALNSSALRLLDLHAEPAQLIEHVFQSALCRHPNEAEQLILAGIVGPTPSVESVSDLLWTVLMLPEFIYVQ